MNEPLPNKIALCDYKDAGSRTLHEILRWSIMDCENPDTTDEIQKICSRLKMLVSQHQSVKIAPLPSEKKLSPLEVDVVKALEIISESTDGVTAGCGILEAVSILASQKDNARHYSDTFRNKLAELGHKYC